MSTAKARGVPWAAAIIVACATRAGSQIPPGLARSYCDDADPANKCPGHDGCCIDSSIEVTFYGTSQGILELEQFEAGAPIEAVIVMDVKERGIQGWSYGVENDAAILSVTSVTT